MTTSDEWLLNHQIARAEKAEARIEGLEAEQQWPIPQAWVGESLSTMLTVLAGALSTVMLPDDAVMPSEAITEMIDHVLMKGPR